jgi:hypothetical protein
LSSKTEITDDLLNKINSDDIKITEEADGFSVEVDDESETYKTLVSVGKNLKEDATDQEAFELALNNILNNYAAK